MASLAVLFGTDGAVTNEVNGEDRLWLASLYAAIEMADAEVVASLLSDPGRRSCARTRRLLTERPVWVCWPTRLQRMQVTPLTLALRCIWIVDPRLPTLRRRLQIAAELSRNGYVAVDLPLPLEKMVPSLPTPVITTSTLRDSFISVLSSPNQAPQGHIKALQQYFNLCLGTAATFEQLMAAADQCCQTPPPRVGSGGIAPPLGSPQRLALLQRALQSAAQRQSRDDVIAAANDIERFLIQTSTSLVSDALSTIEATTRRPRARGGLNVGAMCDGGTLLHWAATQQPDPAILYFVAFGRRYDDHKVTADFSRVPEGLRDDISTQEPEGDGGRRGALISPSTSWSVDAFAKNASDETPLEACEKNFLHYNWFTGLILTLLQARQQRTRDATERTSHGAAACDEEDAADDHRLRMLLHGRAFLTVSRQQRPHVTFAHLQAFVANAISSTDDVEEEENPATTIVNHCDQRTRDFCEAVVARSGRGADEAETGGGGTAARRGGRAAGGRGFSRRGGGWIHTT